MYILHNYIHRYLHWLGGGWGHPPPLQHEMDQNHPLKVPKMSHFHPYTGCSIWKWDILKSYCDFIFGGRHFSPSFLWWKNVYILIFGIKKIQKFQRVPPMIWLIFEIFSQIQILYNEPNHRGDPLKFSEFFLFQISKCTHFSTMRMMEKNVCHQKWSHSGSLKCLISILNTL